MFEPRFGRHELAFCAYLSFLDGEPGCAEGLLAEELDMERVAEERQASAGVGGESALRLTFRTPLYRGATVAMFLSGLGFSAAAPQIASFLVNELGGSLTEAGLFYLTSLTAPVAGYLVGARSDRTGRRLGLFRLCAAAGFVGWAGIALSTQLWMPYVLSAVALAFAGAAASQLFAALHDELSARPSPNNDGVVAVVRMALTGGWVVGPVAGAFLATQTSLRVMLFATALCTLAQIVPLGLTRTRASQSPPTLSAGTTLATEPGAPLASPAETPTAAWSGAPRVESPEAQAAGPAVAGPAEARAVGSGVRGPGVRAMVPLLVFTGLYVLVYAGESIKYAYLPIYMNQQLAFPAGLSGAIIGIQPLVEIVLMPIAVVVARRTGMLRLMVLGAGFGVVANVCFAATGTAAGLFAGQILMGGVWGVFAALGIIVAQRLLPTAVATASAIFMSSTAISSALGGAAGGIGAAVVGLPHVFAIPAVLSLAAVAGLAVMTRKTRPAL
ncbi:MFS transporter [Actinoplanes bogorensis]|uniref:MFS transporter n=1 Tax=Paractinoplanes bogorensis TaxID=1610840 RepID=A0ABS5YLD3_9ACTN|nr:MFS transporter [Actinoplanes bogorensis]MBU2663528.1 MFS transporter [Actinoplanes bogorensis]